MCVLFVLLLISGIIPREIKNNKNNKYVWHKLYSHFISRVGKHKLRRKKFSDSIQCIIRLFVFVWFALPSQNTPVAFLFFDENFPLFLFRLTKLGKPLNSYRTLYYWWAPLLRWNARRRLILLTWKKTATTIASVKLTIQ